MWDVFVFHLDQHSDGFKSEGRVIDLPRNWAQPDWRRVLKESSLVVDEASELIHSYRTNRRARSSHSCSWAERKATSIPVLITGNSAYYCVIAGDLRERFWMWSKFFKRISKGLFEHDPSDNRVSIEAGNEMSSSPTIWLFQLRKKIHHVASEQTFVHYVSWLSPDSIASMVSWNAMASGIWLVPSIFDGDLPWSWPFSGLVGVAKACRG